MNEKINQIVVLKHNYDYSIGDIFNSHGEGWEIRRDRVLENSKYDDTILKNYLIKLIVHNFEKGNIPERKIKLLLLYECVNKYILDHNPIFPKNDEIVVHCRLGDKVTLEERDFQEKHLDQIKDIVKNIEIKKITLLTCFNYGHCPDEGHYEKYALKYTWNCDERHEIYNRNYMSKFIEKVQSIFSKEIQIISNENSDIDFCYGIRAKFLVGGNGGFSALMQDLNKIHHEKE